MKNNEIIEKYHLPVISVIQLEELFAEFILWYDKPYCKSIKGADEVVGEYMSENTIDIP